GTGQGEQQAPDDGGRAAPAGVVVARREARGGRHRRGEHRERAADPVEAEVETEPESRQPRDVDDCLRGPGGRDEDEGDERGGDPGPDGGPRGQRGPSAEEHDTGEERQGADEADHAASPRARAVTPTTRRTPTPRRASPVVGRARAWPRVP